MYICSRLNSIPLLAPIIPRIKYVVLLKSLNHASIYNQSCDVVMRVILGIQLIGFIQQILGPLATRPQLLAARQISLQTSILDLPLSNYSYQPDHFLFFFFGFSFYGPEFWAFYVQSISNFRIHLICTGSDVLRPWRSRVGSWWCNAPVLYFYCSRDDVLVPTLT